MTVAKRWLTFGLMSHPETISIEIDRCSLSGHDDQEARGYAAFLATYLDENMTGRHCVSLGNGGSPPAGYRTVMADGWDAWCGMSEAEHREWID